MRLRYLMLGTFGALFATVVYMVLPQRWQQRIQNKICAPYYILKTKNIKEQLATLISTMNSFYNDSFIHGDAMYIAHGGGVHNYVYTNSIEAFEDSVRKGFKFIEIDLLETIDGHLVGGHGWADLSKLTGKPVSELQNMPLCELKKLRLNGTMHLLCGADISSYMGRYPHLVLVTDIIQNYSLLLKEIPYPDRMIVEITGGNTARGVYNYYDALKTGIKYPAFSAGDDLDFVEHYSFPLIVVNAKQLLNPAYCKKIKKLHQQGITVMAHNSSVCDEPSFINKHIGDSVSLIYSDKWFPCGESPLKSYSSKK